MKKRAIAMLLAASILASVLFTAAMPMEEEIVYDFKVGNALDILKHVVGIQELTEEQIELYDYKGDGIIGTSHALEVLKWLVWMPSAFGENPNPKPPPPPPRPPNPPKPPKQPDPKPGEYVTVSQLNQMGWVELALTPVLVDDLNRTLATFNITTPARIRHFISQCAHESGMGRWTRELASGNDYNSCTFAVVPRPCTPTLRCVGKRLGNEFPGDGPRFKGAGYLQMTGRWNYQQFANYVGDQRVMNGVDFVAATYPWRSAGFWWHNNNMNALIDSGATVEQVTLRVNGGTNGLAERIRLYNLTLSIFR